MSKESISNRKFTVMNKEKFDELVALNGGTFPSNHPLVSVEIFVDTFLPFISVNAEQVSRYSIEESDVTQPTTEELNKDNILFDHTDLNRLKRLGSIKSGITKNEIVLYYDNKYQDIIIVPSALGITNDLEFDNYEEFSSFVIPQRGYRLGLSVKLDASRDFKEFKVKATEDNFIPLKEPTTLDNLSVKYSILRLPGFEETSVTYYRTELSGGEALIDSLGNSLKGFIKLGTVEEIFGVDAEAEVMMYHLYQNKPESLNIGMAHLTKTGNVFIPIDF